VIDIVALIVTSAVVAFVISSLGNLPIPNSITKIINYTNKLGIDIATISPKSILEIMLIITIMLLLRTIFSLQVQKRIYKHFSLILQNVSQKYSEILQDVKYSWLRNVNLELLKYSLSDGLTNLCLVTGAGLVNFISEMIALICMLIAVMLVNSSLCLVILSSLIILGVITHFVASRKSFQLGNLRAETMLAARTNLEAQVLLNRELRLSGQIKIYGNSYQSKMNTISDVTTKYLESQQIPKYLLEISTVVVGLALGFVAQFSGGLVENRRAFLSSLCHC